VFSRKDFSCDDVGGVILEPLQTEISTLEMLSNEDRLLLICARRFLNRQDLAQAQSLIAAGVDWNLLCRHAEKHGLLPLLFHHLEENFSEAIPHLNEHKQRCFKDAVHKLYWTYTLLQVLQALEAAGIRALAYKGPALAAALYGDVALREMSDLDILVDPASLAAAREVLLSLGYRPHFQHSRKQEEARLRSDCECEFSSADGKMMVDLHWAITERHLAPRFNFEELWDRRRVVSLGNQSVPTFSAEDTTLLLAVHGGKHLWQRLSWLTDFAESQRQDLNWDFLGERARNAHAERMLQLGLVLANQIFSVPLPSEFKPGVHHAAAVQHIAANMARTLFEDRNGMGSDRARWLMMVRLADTRWEGLRCGARFAVTSGPREWQAIRLPDSLFGIYSLLRLATVLRAAPSLLFPRGIPGRG
jgi:Uncharacterised nucleotidyltransferase